MTFLPALEACATVTLSLPGTSGWGGRLLSGRAVASTLVAAFGGATHAPADASADTGHAINTTVN